MKTKILRTIMPIMAFLMAMTFAFATETKVSESTTSITGYIHQNGLCKSVQVQCENTVGIPCTYGISTPVFKESTCSVQMNRLP